MTILTAHRSDSGRYKFEIETINDNKVSGVTSIIEISVQCKYIQNYLVVSRTSFSSVFTPPTCKTQTQYIDLVKQYMGFVEEDIIFTSVVRPMTFVLYLYTIQLTTNVIVNVTAGRDHCLVMQTLKDEFNRATRQSQVRIKLNVSQCFWLYVVFFFL